MQPDSFDKIKTGFADPARQCVAVTTSDTTDDPNGPFRGIIICDVSGGATIVALFEDDTSTVTLTNMLEGVVYPFAIKRIDTTSTTAASIFGLK